MLLAPNVDGAARVGGGNADRLDVCETKACAKVAESTKISTERSSGSIYLIIVSFRCLFPLQDAVSNAKKCVMVDELPPMTSLNPC